MKKFLKISFIVVVVVLFLMVLKYFYDSNIKSVVDYDVEEPFRTSINTKIIATGSLKPEEEIELKPQISGIVDEITVEEGDLVEKGDLIAKIRVVPNEQSLASANSRLNGKELKEKAAEDAFVNSYFFVKTGFKIQKVNFSDIKYIEGQGDYLKIVTINEKIMTLQTFKDLNLLLPQNKFIRVHKSYMIGVDYINSIQRNRILINDTVIPISDTYKLAFNEFLKAQGLV